MAYNFNKKNFFFALCILLLMGCKKETISPVSPIPNYFLQKIERDNHTLNFLYNDFSKINSLGIIDKTSNANINYKYFYNESKTLTQVSVDEVKYIFEYDSPNSFTIFTIRLPDETLFKDKFLLTGNKITQHIHYAWESNQLKPEAKYDYIYYAD